jgi:hypothetical protein
MLSQRSSAARTVLLATLTLILGLAALPLAARAQDEASVVPEDTTGSSRLESYPTSIAGEFTPGKGFNIIKTKRGSLNISGYGLLRYLNQMPGDQTFTDHLGRKRTVKARNDINWHRSMVWVSGFLYVPQMRYTMTIWSLPTTQQTLVFGNLFYTVNKALTFGGGIAPNLTARSMEGSWPYWAATDRQMGEEFFRAGFSSGFFIRGEPISRLSYIASVNTNLSQLGVTAADDSRDFAYSTSLTWMPTTGEFGARGGVPDLEDHQQLATRFGVSACTAKEGRGAPVGQPNKETQLRLSDGVYAFEEGALADTVTVKNLNYTEVAVSAGVKYHGFSLMGEAYYRKLSNFDATSPLPLSKVEDQGFQVEAMHMFVPKTLGIYVAGGYVSDDFKRFPWEVAGGASLFPFHSYLWRLNLHVVHVEKSPTGSNFGYYTAGQTGTTLSLATDVLF